MKQIIELIIYEKALGKQPFNIWLEALDFSTILIVETRLARIRSGNIGNCESIKSGLQEIKIDYGPGYRIYFVKIKNNVFLILNAGSKKSQSRDIKKAKEYWLDFKEKNR